jgi:hypothetical protein
MDRADLPDRIEHMKCFGPLFARESPTPDGSANGKAGQRLPKREYEPEWGSTDLTGRCVGG